MSSRKKIVRCSRCKKRRRRSNRNNGWAEHFDAGKVTAHICGDCLTVMEHIESEVNSVLPTVTVGEKTYEVVTTRLIS